MRANGSSLGEVKTARYLPTYDASARPHDLDDMFLLFVSCLVASFFPEGRQFGSAFGTKGRLASYAARVETAVCGASHRIPLVCLYKGVAIVFG